MLRRNDGYTISELAIVIVLIGIASTIMTMAFNATYRDLGQMSSVMMRSNDQVLAMQRMAQVIRSGTRITEATNVRLTIFAYFSPGDATLSQVTYYLDPANEKLKVDKIPATGSPPTYTYNPANKRTAILINSYSQVGDLFKYYDAIGDTGPFNVDEMQNIQKITIGLHNKAYANVAQQDLTTTVILRNRKVNF